MRNDTPRRVSFVEKRMAEEKGTVGLSLKSQGEKVHPSPSPGRREETKKVFAQVTAAPAGRAVERQDEVEGEAEKDAPKGKGKGKGKEQGKGGKGKPRPPWNPQKGKWTKKGKKGKGGKKGR